MNYRIVFNNIGKLMIVEGAVMFVPLFTAILYREWIYAFSFLIAIAVSVAAGILMNFIKFGTRDIRIMDGFMIVALSWIFMSLTGAIPFFLSGDIPNYGNAVFETISGLTTTGATIVPHIEAMGYSTLLWRSMTNWLGGMGMLVFMLAVIPLKKNENSLFIFKAESSGPDVTKIVPSMRESAKILYGIYIILTLLEVIFLAIGGMPIFDSICHALSTGGTGGFSIKDQSIGYYNSTYITVVIGIFMILFAINYAYYFLIFTGKVRDVLKSTELRIFVGLLVFSIVTITFVIRRFYPSLKDAALNAFFNTAAMITSTGFASDDYNHWPGYARVLLLLLMMIGSCAGSTACGIKISRIVILLKAIAYDLRLVVNPRLVKTVRLDDKIISQKTVRSVYLFISVYVVILFGSMLLISFNEFDMTTTFSAAIATLNNIGPGFGLIGPDQNYEIMSPFTKVVLCFNMLAGRLELFPMLILFLPRAWKRS